MSRNREWSPPQYHTVGYGRAKVEGRSLGRGQQSLATLAKSQGWKELDLASILFHVSKGQTAVIFGDKTG